MRFKEPLNLECSHCKATFQVSLSWIRQVGQVCPTCEGDLSAVRASIENAIDGWRLVSNSTGLALRLERRFPVEFNNEDLEAVRTVSDLIETTSKLLERRDQVVKRMEIEAEIVRIIRNLSNAQLEVITPETKLLDLGSISISVRSR